MSQKRAYLNARLSFQFISEREKQQPKSETAKAAEEEIRRKSYREIEDSAELIEISLKHAFGQTSSN